MTAAISSQAIATLMEQVTVELGTWVRTVRLARHKQIPCATARPAANPEAAGGEEGGVGEGRPPEIPLRPPERAQPTKSS